ncbi:ABC transporter substrate-binding protein [Azospirillum sp. sgz301742]
MRGWILKTAAVLTLLPGLVHAQARTDLVVGMQLEPPNLDPTASAAAAISEVTLVNLYEALTRIDAEGAVGPGLAKSWTVSDDALTYTFKLRETAKFHNGKPATSADVKFTLDRARAADSTNPQKAWFKAIAAVDTPDPQTAIVTLSRPDGLFLFHMGLGAAVIQSAETQAGDKQTPIGTGPFKFERWIAGDRVVLVRNPDYDGPKPALERVSFRFIADPAAQVSSILAGDVDTVPQFNTYEALPQFKNDPRFRVVIGTSEGETLLSTNNARKPFDDVRVRRAMAHAIDRTTLIEGAMSGLATPIGSHFAPNRPEYVDLTGMYPYDVKKAKALLAEAGYPNGFETTLRLPPPIYARRSGELIAAMLAEVGIRARIENLEWAQWLEKVFRGKDFDLTIVAHTEALDIDIYSRPDYYFGYKSDRFNALNAELERTLDPARRKALYGDMQRVLAEDAVNGFLFQLPVVTVENAKVQGMWKNRPYQVNDVTGVRWQ